MEITLQSNRTILNTAGKYCAEDIVVSASLQDKTVTPTASTQTISADANHVGLGTVTVNAVPTETKTVTAGTSATTVTPTSGKFLTSVTVNPTPSIAKTATPTKTSQTISPDSGKLLSGVTVNPIPDEYIIPSGTKDITANGTADVTSFATVNVAVPGPDMSDATATTGKILLGATAYTGAGKITGTIPTYGGLIRPDDPIMPLKGDIITMDSRQYRVLKTNGTVAEVLCMYDASSSLKFDTDYNNFTNTYEGKNIDTYCNDTFYGGLSATMQSAIVDKTFTQDSWQWNGGSSAIANYNAKYGSSTYVLSLMNETYGSTITRHCYCLSCQDVIDYLEVSESMTIDNTTLTDVNIWQMFWNQSTSVSTSIWLRSANFTNSSFTFAVDKLGNLSSTNANARKLARPAFQIDLSKVDWIK